MSFMTNSQKKKSQSFLSEIIISMSRLPTYALALKNRGFSRSGPQNFTPVKFYDEYESEYNSRQTVNKEEEEINKLRGIVDDLQMQIERLMRDQSQVDEIEREIEEEKQYCQELKSKIESATVMLRNAQETTKLQNDQVVYFESILSGKNQLASSKEQMLMRLHAEYNSLISDYKRILNTTQNQTVQIRQAGEQIDELQAEIESIKLEHSRQEFNDSFSDSLNRNSPFINNNRNIPEMDEHDDFQSPNNKNNTPSSTRDSFDIPQNNAVPAAMRDSLNFSIEPEPIVSPRRSPNRRPPSHLNSNTAEFPINNSCNTNSPTVHPAMRDSFTMNDDELMIPTRGPLSPVRTETPRAMTDNISFGAVETDKKAFADIDSMTVAEMKNELRNLQAEKEEIERILSKSPEKGMSLTRSRRIHEENETRLDSVEQRMGKLRLVLKQMHVL
ncbi:hypothetical protein TRFO_20056 [Tritrichomonas foetus]|uniref:Uncharacterized protein n=1 Tax=Tritrichomonas foetus TaxID=1144522 RepID=A0A1J4KI09_9EUKA|nr:hypothetical protein TRFO_20056 [Tritrichomonas foetus]|eukprot:OHT10568.1 hypothetical protein TRFO_20056 [Tritrichomonas foetus]